MKAAEARCAKPYSHLGPCEYLQIEVLDHMLLGIIDRFSNARKITSPF